VTREDPIIALERGVRSDAGHQPAMGAALRRALELQYREHPRWSYKLHYDNIVALAALEFEIGCVPSYSTVRRYMRTQGMVKHRRKRRRKGEHVEHNETLVQRERRSFEVSHVQGLWHSDFHVGSRKVLLPSGEQGTPVLFGMLDDYSRLACHLQWYLAESSETFAHGLSQALQKRGLPRALLTDNGKAMTAAEIEQGLERLSIAHWTTLPYTPEQNAKQESFWGQVEGRLLPMLENERELTLGLLNRATAAWVELEYNHSHHSEIGCSPYERFIEGPSVGRPPRSSDHFRRALRMEQRRTQRRISVEGKRFELPSRYRTLQRPSIRYARWDLSTVDLVDSLTGARLCSLLPLDKQKNADGRRRTLEPPVESVVRAHRPPRDGVAPLLNKLMADYAATGLPPAYVPHNTETNSEDPDE